MKSYAKLIKIYKFALSFEKRSSFYEETGCSAARLAHLLWEQGVAGSNPATPTIKA
jgi:hypothetical protein